MTGSNEQLIAVAMLAALALALVAMLAARESGQGRSGGREQSQRGHDRRESGESVYFCEVNALVEPEPARGECLADNITHTAGHSPSGAVIGHLLTDNEVYLRGVIGDDGAVKL